MSFSSIVYLFRYFLQFYFILVWRLCDHAYWPKTHLWPSPLGAHSWISGALYSPIPRHQVELATRIC